MKQKTKLSLANPRGFCAGVDRAIEIVNRALDMFGSPIYVKHEVVHNKVVVEDLRARDSRDINRKISPLIIPDDAVVINNENKSIDEVIEIIKKNLKLQ